MEKLSRRAFNNILIISVLCFIMLFNLPIVNRNFLSQPENKQEHSQIISLLPKSFSPKVIYFDHLVLSNEDGHWKSNIALSISAKELVERWSDLSGTYVNEALLEKIKPFLNQSFTSRIEDSKSNQSYHLTYYQTPDFWLMQNWQGQWLAVSVDPQYLMPVN